MERNQKPDAADSNMGQGKRKINWKKAIQTYRQRDRDKQGNHISVYSKTEGME